MMLSELTQSCAITFPFLIILLLVLFIVLTWIVIHNKHTQKLTNERNERAAILESLVEGVIAVDKEMNVTYANRMALQMISMQSAELLGKNFSIAKQPQSFALLNECQQAKHLLTGTATLDKESSKLYLDIVAAPIGEGSGAILVMQDQSTHYKLLEMRKDFITNASHELKTPITIIRGFAEMLHDNPDLPRSTSEEITEKIVNSCDRMTALIKDLLILSDVENIPLHRLTKCDLPAIAASCCHTLQNAYPNAQFHIHTIPEQKLHILADSNLMELAFINLIENGAKYSDLPAQVDISFEKLPAQLKITIADKGIGIPAADLDHIFERFYTVNKAHAQKMGGSGLGLSIVQTIVHKHFGQISVSSEIGKGTAFTILLPLRD